MAFRADPAAAFLRDFGTTVVCGSLTTTGTLESLTIVATESDLGMVQTTRHVLRIPFGSLGTIVPDTALTIGGVAYVVSYAGDDAMSRVGPFAEDNLVEPVIVRRG